MSEDLILIESEDGLDMITSLDQARERIKLLIADNRHLRKGIMSYRDELNAVYNALYTIKAAVTDGIDIVLEARRNR